MLAKEARHARYTEPLWRRIAPGSETPTERVTGGSDPANPGVRRERRDRPAEQAVIDGPLPGPVSGGRR